MRAWQRFPYAQRFYHPKYRFYVSRISPACVMAKNIANKLNSECLRFFTLPVSWETTFGSFARISWSGRLLDVINGSGTVRTYLSELGTRVSVYNVLCYWPWRVILGDGVSWAQDKWKTTLGTWRDFSLRFIYILSSKYIFRINFGEKFHRNFLSLDFF